MQAKHEGVGNLNLPSDDSIEIIDTSNHMLNTSLEAKTNTFLYPRLRDPTASESLHQSHNYGNDRFSKPNTRLFYNEINALTHRVVMETTSWRIQVQTSSRLKQFITTNAKASNAQLSQMTDLYQIWNMTATPAEYGVGIYKFEKNEWDDLIFQFCDLTYYTDQKSAKTHNGGNQFTTKDLKRLGAVSESDAAGLTNSYLNDDIINTITCDILQPFTNNAVFWSTHYYTFIRTMMSKPALCKSDILQLLRWGKKYGKDAAQLLKSPTSTAIIHINSNHW